MDDAHLHDPAVHLMLAYQAGSEPAFDRLVEEYSGQVYSLLTRFLGARPEREDLVQETFLRVIRARDRYRPTARFSTWLFRIVYNLCVNLTERSTSRAGRRVDFGRAEPGAGESGWEGDIEDERAEEPTRSLERADLVRAVRQAIAELPQTQRMALILAKYEEMPHSEIARVLRSSEKAIKSMIHRARENLRARLGPLLEGELT